MSNKNFTNKYKSNFTPMTPKKDGTKKTVAFWVLFVLIILWTVGSIFGTLSFFNVKLNSNTYTAKADSVTETYAYEGNSFYLPTNTYTGNYPYIGMGGTRPFLLQFDYRISFPYTEQGDISPILDFRAYTDAAYPPLSGLTSDNETYYNSFDDGYFRVDMLNSNSSNVIYLQYKDIQGYTAKYGYLQVTYENGFNGSVQRIEFSSTDFTNSAALSNHYYVFFYYLKLFDNNNKYFQFEFTSTFNPLYVSRQALTFDTRTYYISNAFTDNQNYQNGYDYGYQQGKNDYTNSGYQDGLKIGYNQGYNQGKTDGIASANDYTFLGLFSALIDAPIQALSGLFNFNVMGINMFSLVSGLFTLFVVLIIVRLILGGGIGG